MRPTPAQIEPVSARAYGCDPGAPVAPERRRVGDAVVLVGVLSGEPDSALAVERAGRVVTPPAHGYQPAAELRTVRRLARLQQHSLAGELPVALPDDEAGLREDGVAHEVEQHDEVAFSVRHQRREASSARRPTSRAATAASTCWTCASPPHRWSGTGTPSRTRGRSHLGYQDRNRFRV